VQLSLEKEEISGTIYTDEDHMGRVVLPNSKAKKNQQKKEAAIVVV
jgi:hypothetical protein